MMILYIARAWLLRDDELFDVFCGLKCLCGGFYHYLMLFAVS